MKNAELVSTLLLHGSDVHSNKGRQAFVVLGGDEHYLKKIDPLLRIINLGGVEDGSEHLIIAAAIVAYPTEANLFVEYLCATSRGTTKGLVNVIMGVLLGLNIVCKQNLLKELIDLEVSVKDLLVDAMGKEADKFPTPSTSQVGKLSEIVRDYVHRAGFDSTRRLNVTSIIKVGIERATISPADHILGKEFVYKAFAMISFGSRAEFVRKVLAGGEELFTTNP